MEWISDPAIWASLLSLTVLEIVLGIDNIIFLSVITQSLPPEQAHRARQIGLALALVFRILLLFTITWLTQLTAPLFTVSGHVVSWRDIILIAGGLFLMVKATQEVHSAIEGAAEEAAHPSKTRPANVSFNFIIGQIVLIDVIFSLDSIITAVGMSDNLWVMVTAVCIAVAVMYLAATPVTEFVKRHPTTKMLALCFLMLIGVALVADGAGFHIPRGYIYFAMAFAAAVEIFNVLAKRSPAAEARVLPHLVRENAIRNVEAMPVSGAAGATPGARSAKQPAVQPQKQNAAKAGTGQKTGGKTANREAAPAKGKAQLAAAQSGKSRPTGRKKVH